MAKKKSKRPNLPQETLERARAEMRSDSAPVSVATEAPVSAAAAAGLGATPKKVKRPGASSASRRIPTTQELIVEYQYVLHDLRNILILSAILLIAIIIARLVFAVPVG